MTTVVFFLEEPSTEAMLQILIPKILSPSSFEFHYVCFEGKQDMEKRLGLKLRGWLKPATFFVVIRDQDSGDCRIIKESLREKCHAAGKDNVLIRIACHELESFYLGDLLAVETGLMMKGLSKRQQQSKYREPDKLANPARELENLTGTIYQKVGGSRAIAPHLSLEEGVNRSHSFRVLIRGLKDLAYGNIRDNTGEPLY